MEVIFPDIDKSRIQVHPEDIALLLGTKENHHDAHAATLVEQYIGVCRQLMAPSAACIYRDTLEADSAEHIAIEGLTFRTGKIVQNMLRQSTRYAFFLVTVGVEPEKLARDLLERGEYLEAYITDLVASALVDSVAACVHEDIRKKADLQGLKVTNRYSPGYCSWDVAEQQKLFTLFPENACGISLSDSSLMNPVKSISGIIGTGPRVTFNEYTCEICPMKTCQFRKPKNQL
jgi:hypothetical protein